MKTALVCWEYQTLKCQEYSILILGMAPFFRVTRENQAQRKQESPMYRD